MTSELDYAFLAQWARINFDGTLTAIDASFLRVAARIGTMLPLSVAGRVRFLDEPYEAQLSITLEMQDMVMEYSASVSASEATSYGDGRRHALFALTTQLPVQRYGDYRVRVSLDGQRVRDLLFSVLEPE